MHALILLAGYGSRLGREDLPHKVFLPFGEGTLLSRHLDALAEAGCAGVTLVVGHNAPEIRARVGALPDSLPIAFVDNPRYRTTGNTLSLILGLRTIDDEVLVLDGDVLYPRGTLARFLTESRPSCFALVPADVDDVECAKVLARRDGALARFVTKRALTEEERRDFVFRGEAIGFFTLAREAVRGLLRVYDARPGHYDPTLWEILFSDAAPELNLTGYDLAGPGCFEIDTPEDYAEALAYFEAHRARY